MARDETNGRDMELRGRGIRRRRNGDEARRREWKGRRVILIKAPLSGGKKENNPIKTPSRLRRIHQAEDSSVMSQRRLIYTTDKTKNQKMRRQRNDKTVKQRRRRLIVTDATFVFLRRKNTSSILHLLIYDCLFPFYFRHANF